MNNYTKEIFDTLGKAATGNTGLVVETVEVPSQFFPEKGSSGHLMSVVGGGITVRVVSWESPKEILPRFFLAVWKNGTPIFETPSVADSIDFPEMQANYLPFLQGTISPC